MGSLTTCLRQAREFLADDIHDGNLKRAAELRANGSTVDEAKMQAAREALQAVRDGRAEVEAAKAEGRTLYEPLPPEQQPKPAPAPEMPNMPPELVAVSQQFPDLVVQMDGMDAPMRLAEFLDAARAESDEMMAEAPLYQLAAECALTNGV